MPKVYIYGLVDPRNSAIRYVGKSIRPKERLKDHIQRASRSRRRKARWINSLCAIGLQPQLVYLEETIDEFWEDRERWWIKHCKELGYDLTNHTEGGDGVHKPDEESRKRLSESRKKLFTNAEFKSKMQEVYRNPERRRKISEGLTNKPKDPEHISKLPQNKSGWKQSEEAKKKISVGLRGNKNAKGKKHTEETKEKISEALKGNQHTKDRVLSAEEKLIRSESLKGRIKTEEHKEKIRLGP
jgi:hypothetical protein